MDTTNMHFGLRKICESHDTILIDTCAISNNLSLQATHTGLHSGTREQIDHQIQYLRHLHDLLDSGYNILTVSSVIRECYAGNTQKFTQTTIERGKRKESTIKKHCREYLALRQSFTSKLARRVIFPQDGIEYDYHRIVRGYDWIASRNGVSETDLELIATAHAIGLEGKTNALISNDENLCRTWKHVRTKEKTGQQTQCYIANGRIQFVPYKKHFAMK